MADVRYHEVSPNEEGQRLDNLLIRLLKGVPKSFIYRIIRGGEVRVNKKRAAVSLRLLAGDKIRIPPLRAREERVLSINPGLAQHLQNAILYENESFLLINKPAGLAVHGGSGLSLGLIEALRLARTDLSYLELVHRLDKETSGCILVAKKRSILRELQTLLVQRTIEKTYWSLHSGVWKQPKLVRVNAPLKKNILQSGERLVNITDAGKEALTQFQLLENFEDCCLVSAKPYTGRTHQIRVHSAHLSHPIIGDVKYGGPISHLSLPKRLYLHAHSLRFILRDTPYYFEAPLDTAFTDALTLLRSGRLVSE